MLALLRTAVAHTSGPFSIRYPRDTAPDVPAHISRIEPVPFGTWEILRRGADLAILAVGTMVLPALEAAEALAADGVSATVVNCRFLKPVDEAVLRRFRVDFRGVGLGTPDSGGNVWLDERTFQDEWGVVRTRPPGAYYYDLVGSPLAADGRLQFSRKFRHMWESIGRNVRFWKRAQRYAALRRRRRAQSGACRP